MYAHMCSDGCIMEQVSHVHNSQHLHLKTSCQNTGCPSHMDDIPHVPEQRRAPWTFVVSELVVLSGAAVEQRRIADREQQLHHAEAAALAAETRAQLDARQNEPRAIDLKSIGRT